MSDQPPILPNHRESSHGRARGSSRLIARADRDDFVRNLLTVLDVNPDAFPPGALDYWPGGEPLALSPSASDREPVVTLVQIKLHCHIEPDQTVEDNQLLLLEMAAHIHTENVLRRPGELDASAPENVKLAVLVLIAHWYRNREAIADQTMTTVPLAYDALLSPEREYSEFY